MKRRELPRSVLERRAIVYVRRSTMMQTRVNLESQKLQYELARSYGFVDAVGGR